MEVFEQQLFCPHCDCTYNSSERSPRVLPGCGDSICLSCIDKLLSQKRRCPKCNDNFDQQFNNVNQCQTNSALMTLIREKEDRTKCHLHNKKLKIFCMTDKTRICTMCIVKGDHQSHKRKYIKDMTEDLVDKNLRLKNVIEKKRENKAVAQTLLNDKEDSLTRRFTDATMSLMDLKEEFIEQVKWFTDSQQKIVQDKFKDAPLEREISKLKDIHDVLSNDNFAPALENGLLKPDYQLDQTSLEKCLEKEKTFLDSIVASVTKIEDIAENSFNKFNMAISELKDIASANWLKLNELGEDNGPNLQNSHLNSMVLGETTLKLWVDKRFKERTVSRGTLENIIKIEIDINLIQALQDEDFAMLTFISKESIQVTSLDITFSSRTFSHRRATRFLQALFSNPKRIEKLSISACPNRENCKEHLNVLFEDILPQLTSLKNISVNLARDERFRHSDYADAEMASISVRMENIQSYSLHIHSAYISDEAFIKFIENTLCSMKGLKELQLNLNFNSITDKSIMYMFEHFPQLEKLHLDLSYIFITDKSIELFIQETIPRLTALKELKMNVKGPKTTDRMEKRLADALKVVNSR